MRRRRSINVWPAFADLMTVLAVVGLFTAIEMRKTWADEKASLEAKIENEEMFQAIQEVQEMINDFSRERGLAFKPDQSLEFGDDLVSFELNSLDPTWKGDGEILLRQFCALVTQRLSGHIDLFSVNVEGHTDSSGCPEDPNCNWWISSSRAAAFLALMRDESLCPGGHQWNLLPIGFADTKPRISTTDSTPEITRRISVRIVPNYEKILDRNRKPGRPQ